MRDLDVLAVQLNALINSKPRSPTIEELKAVCRPFVTSHSLHRYVEEDDEDDDLDKYTYNYKGNKVPTKSVLVGKMKGPVTPVSATSVAKKAKTKPIPTDDADED